MTDMLYLKLFDNISAQFHMYYLNFIKIVFTWNIFEFLTFAFLNNPLISFNSNRKT